MSASSSFSARRPSVPTTPSPPKKSSMLLPGLVAYPDTPPSSPLLNIRQNAFAQWSPSSSPVPSSPTLSQDQWSHPGTDTESEAGFQSDRELEDEGELPEGVRTPKGHPLGAWGPRKSKGLGLGLGLGRFGFNQNQKVLSVSEEMFEKRAERKRDSIHDRSTFLISTTSTSRWSFPKVRAPRKRGAMYGFAAIFFFLVFLTTHSKFLNRTAGSTRPLSSLPLRRSHQQIHFADDALAAGGGAPTRRGSIQTTAARKRGTAQHLATAPVDAEEWKWAGKDMELASLLTFMVSSEANTVPKVDPSAPLDPHLVLDFDPFSVRATKDLREMRATLWRDHPVILLSQTRNAHSRFIKSTLADLHIHPAPLIMDIDQRTDADILLPLFQRLIGQSDLPILLVGGELVGGWTEVDRLTSMSLLKPLISSHGGFFVPPKHKKKKRAGHGGKSEEEIRKALEAEKKQDEIKRRDAAVEKEELRLREIAQGKKEVVPVEDESDPENF